jgi:hypothetical protein
MRHLDNIILMPYTPERHNRINNRRMTMAQLFSHILPKRREDIGEVRVTSVSEETTLVTISSDELLDLLVHFACDKTGLEKKDMTSIRLHQSLYGNTDINHSMIASFTKQINTGD